ncbi:hypothetical protein KAR91_52605 [Candidatus Pacearchaeota archaeon]|nr:hypothetical protein [Candidatus Pacearchaeota archaeon]
MDKDLTHECPKCKGLFYQATTCAKCMVCTKPLNSKTESGANVPLDRLVMPYAVEQRLRFIDFLLSQYGHVNRSATMDYFGIGAATATRDFKAYKGLCKDNVIYDDVDKSYHRSNRFKRIWA